MDRRSALRSFVILSAGIAFVPSCRETKVKSDLALKHLPITGDQEAMLASLAETIVPVKAEAPADAAHVFVLTMVNDCYTAEDQQKFMKGMEAFNDKADKQFGLPFAELPADQKKDLVTEMQKQNELKEPVNFFYNTTRSLTLQHYTSSKYYLVNVRKFEMAPGRFNGCFPIAKKPA